MSRKFYILLTLLMLSAMAFTACSSTDTAEEAPAEEAAGEDASEDTGETTASGEILQRVLDRGTLVCGGRTDLAGFGSLDGERNVGFDIDLCRAVAAAVLGDGDAIEIIPLTGADRGPSLQTAQVDLLTRNVTWTTSRNAQWGNFATIMFYDGQGFMVANSSGITSTADFDGATVCVTSGTTTEQNVADFFRQNDMSFEAVVFEETAAVYSAFEDGRCDVTTSDRSQLVSVRSGFANPADYTILPDIISKEPLTPAVPHGDDVWFDIVSTVMAALINAEELGVTQANVEEMKSSDNIAVLRLLGVEGDWGYTDLGLDAGALGAAIAAVGNYGEIYDRNLGPDAVVTLPRGFNELWSNGGLIYAPPVK